MGLALQQQDITGKVYFALVVDHLNAGMGCIGSAVNLLGFTGFIISVFFAQVHNRDRETGSTNKCNSLTRL